MSNPSYLRFQETGLRLLVYVDADGSHHVVSGTRGGPGDPLTPGADVARHQEATANLAAKDVCAGDLSAVVSYLRDRTRKNHDLSGLRSNDPIDRRNALERLRSTLVGCLVTGDGFEATGTLCRRLSVPGDMALCLAVDDLTRAAVRLTSDPDVARRAAAQMERSLLNAQEGMRGRVAALKARLAEPVEAEPETTFAPSGP